MCGIAGLISFEEKIPDRALLHRMANTIAQRGPDAEGIHVGPHVGLAQRRLSIVDLSDSANPPLCNEDGSIWIAFNGEIYNYQAIRKELVRKGHVFTTHSDTEVLIHLYEEAGTDMLERLEGMFAFAIWDGRRKRLFAARDRLGKKPFIYTKTDSFFAFGSAIRAVTAIPGVPKEPDYAAIDSYLTNRCVPSPATAFKNISKLRAGHALVCDVNGSLRVYRYWAPPLGGENVTAEPEELRANLMRLLEDSVKKRMVADVPIGALLSGGIDSGLVVALMARFSVKPVKTFTVGFGDPERDELNAARLVAKRYDTQHTEITVKPNVRDLLTDLVRHYNEPFADSSAVPSYYVCKAARSEVKVALCGDGGDESFSGYSRYGEVQSWGMVDLMPSFVKKSVASFGRAILEVAPRNNATAKVDRGLAMMEGDLPERYALTMALVKPQEKRDWYSHAFAAEIAGASLEAESDWTSGMDSLNWMSYQDQRNYLPDCLMVKMDVASMANGLEVRAPLLDHALIDFAASVPGYLKRQGALGKILLRDVAEDLLPPEIRNRPKTGFDMPVAAWLRSDLRGVLDEYLLDETSKRRGLFNQAAIAHIVAQHSEGKRDWSNRLWALLMLEIWFREHID